MGKRKRFYKEALLPSLLSPSVSGAVQVCSVSSNETKLMPVLLVCVHWLVAVSLCSGFTHRERERV